MARKIVMFPQTKKILEKLEITNDQYVAAVNNVRAYTVQIKEATKGMYSMLPLNPETQDSVNECVSEIYGFAQQWALIEQTLNLCDSQVAKYAEKVKKHAQQCEEYIKKYEKDPEDKGIIGDIISHFEDAADYADNMEEDIIDCITNLKNYMDGKDISVASLKAELQKVIDDLMRGEDVDQEKIDQLNDDIQKMQNEITRLALELTGFSVAAASSIAGIVLGCVFGGLFGGIVCGIFFGVPLVIAGYYIYLDSEQVVACKKQIEMDTQKMTAYENEIVAMQTIQKTFSSFLDNIGMLIDMLGTINDAWGNLGQDCKEMQQDFDDAAADLKKADWDEMLGELDEIITACSQVAEHAAVVNIPETEVSKAQIDIGMSAKEIEAAVNAAEKMSYQDYMLVV